MTTLRPAHRHWDPDPELLDAEAWDAPALLSPADCLIQAGMDRRWHLASFDDPENDHD